MTYHKYHNILSFIKIEIFISSESLYYHCEIVGLPRDFSLRCYEQQISEQPPKGDIPAHRNDGRFQRIRDKILSQTHESNPDLCFSFVRRTITNLGEKTHIFMMCIHVE